MAPTGASSAGWEMPMSSATLLTVAIYPDPRGSLSVDGPTRSAWGRTDGIDGALLAGRARDHRTGRRLLAGVAHRIAGASLGGVWHVDCGCYRSTPTPSRSISGRRPDTRS